MTWYCVVLPGAQIDHREVVLAEVDHVGNRPGGVEEHPGRATADLEGGHERRAGRIEDVDLAGVEAVDEETIAVAGIVLIEERRARAGLAHVGRGGDRATRLVLGDVEADQIGRDPLEGVDPLRVARLSPLRRIDELRAAHLRADQPRAQRVTRRKEDVVVIGAGDLRVTDEVATEARLDRRHRADHRNVARAGEDHFVRRWICPQRYVQIERGDAEEARAAGGERAVERRDEHRRQRKRVWAEKAGPRDVEQRDAACEGGRGGAHQVAHVEKAADVVRRQRVGLVGQRYRRRVLAQDRQRRAAVDDLLIALGQRRRRRLCPQGAVKRRAKRVVSVEGGGRDVDVGERGVAPHPDEDSSGALIGQAGLGRRELQARIGAVLLPGHLRCEAADQHRRVGLNVAALVAVEDVRVQQIPAAILRVAAGQRVDVVLLRTGRPLPGAGGSIAVRAVVQPTRVGGVRRSGQVLANVRHHQRSVVEAEVGVRVGDVQPRPACRPVHHRAGRVEERVAGGQHPLLVERAGRTSRRPRAP